MLRLLALVLALSTAWGVLPAAADPPTGVRNGSTFVRIDDDTVSIGNSLVRRTWDRGSFQTTSLIDRRTRQEWTAGSSDLNLSIGGIEVAGASFRVMSATAESIENGVRVTMDLESPLLSVTRTVEVYESIAGFHTETTLHLDISLPLRGYTLESVGVGPVRPTIHAFRAGADWREPGWTGPQGSIGDPHAGTWRDSRSAAPGESLEGPAQWISTSRGDARMFIVLERNDQPSSRAAYDGTTAGVQVDHSRDVLSLGPFEEQLHVEHPADAPGRQRIVGPGDVTLEPTFLGLAENEIDEGWQFFSYLTEHRLAAYDHSVTFNSNGTDANRISTGAKDDLDYGTILEVAPIARRLGVETFILDDGWQAISGDWEPDSPEHPEPRWDGSPDSKFVPRFPDSEFAAVTEAIAPMELGLWMSPMHFNHNSETFTAHPEWACTPVGQALAGYNALQPDSGSNEAGLGTWGPDAIPHVESRIREAIESWGADYFKFDFLVWLDCAGQGDLYSYRERFVRMVDRLRRDHPEVTFQIDETNDYRLFPFESVARGPSWFQNGAPEPDRLLHNMWNLAPFIPASSLGQHVLGGRAFERHPVDTLMAAALPSHITFFDDLRELPDEVVERAGQWMDLYRSHRDHFTQMMTPLLEDPIARGWTALQVFDHQEGFGSLLVFRQEGGEAAMPVPMRGIPPGLYEVTEGPGREPLGTFSHTQLERGLEIALERDGAAVLLLDRAGS